MIDVIYYSPEDEQNKFFTYKRNTPHPFPVDDKFKNAVHKGLVDLRNTLISMVDDMMSYHIYRIKHKDIPKLKYGYDCDDFFGYVPIFEDEEYCYLVQIDY